MLPWPMQTSPAAPDQGAPRKSWWDTVKEYWGWKQSMLDVHPAALTSNNVTHNNVSTAETHVGNITINTQATDARGIAMEIAPMLKNRATMMAANNIAGGPV